MGMTTLGAAILLAVIFVGVLVAVLAASFLLKIVLELWEWFMGGRG